MRGEPGCSARPGESPRLTPASAGRTRGGRRRCCGSTAYPRECGENRFGQIDGGGRPGLPPRVRGEPQSHRRGDATRRLTPASAGRTVVLPCYRSDGRAYPRECGENPCRPRRVSRRHGLPPRVRGEPRRASPKKSREGLTPASAGRTSAKRVSTNRSRAYPRECGENPPGQRRGTSNQGLPPRVRGELVSPLHQSALMRLTPASAGRTTHQGIPSCTGSAYPRECGENLRW